MGTSGIQAQQGLLDLGASGSFVTKGVRLETVEAKTCQCAEAHRKLEESTQDEPRDPLGFNIGLTDPANSS